MIIKQIEEVFPNSDRAEAIESHFHFADRACAIYIDGKPDTRRTQAGLGPDLNSEALLSHISFILEILKILPVGKFKYRSPNIKDEKFEFVFFQKEKSYLRQKTVKDGWMKSIKIKSKCLTINGEKLVCCGQNNCKFVNSYQQDYDTAIACMGCGAETRVGCVSDQNQGEDAPMHAPVEDSVSID
jgi:hypothetical protein